MTHPHAPLAAGPESRVVVVTGASAGVGRATARAFAKRGADVAVIARSSAGLKAARAEIEAEGGHGLDLAVDVSDADALEEAAATVEHELGPIDVWVNNAMVSVFAPFQEISAPDFARVNAVTYLGYVYGTMAALRRMAPRNRGCIIQVGSALAYRSIPLQSAYCGAKHAIKGFTESVRCELLHDKSDVKVTMVHLPALNTPQFHWVKTTLKRHPQPVPPIFQPEVAAEAIVWASENVRREVHVGLPTTLSILANKFIPGLLDHYLGWTGYDSQQTDFAIEPDRPDNLWQPIDGDYGAHGQFDDRAFTRSVQWWFTTRRRMIAAAAGGVGLALWRSRK